MLETADRNGSRDSQQPAQVLDTVIELHDLSPPAACPPARTAQSQDFDPPTNATPLCELHATGKSSRQPLADVVSTYFALTFEATSQNLRDFYGKSRTLLHSPPKFLLTLPHSARAYLPRIQSYSQRSCQPRRGGSAILPT